MSTEDARPTLEDRRAVYASWRQKLDRRVDDNRALVAGDEAPVAAPDDTWDPQRLFDESRRLADAG